MILNYQKFLNENLNKYEIFEDVVDAFLEVLDMFEKTQASYSNEISPGEYMIYINDTNENQYADNSFNLNLVFDQQVPYGISHDIEILKGTKYYNPLKSSLSKLKKISEVKKIRISYYGGEYDDGIQNRRKQSLKITINGQDLQGSEIDKWLDQHNFDYDDIYLEKDYPKLGLKMRTTKYPSSTRHVSVINMVYKIIGEFEVSGSPEYGKENIHLKRKATGQYTLKELNSKISHWIEKCWVDMGKNAELKSSSIEKFLQYLYEHQEEFYSQFKKKRAGNHTN